MPRPDANEPARLPDEPVLPALTGEPEHPDGPPRGSRYQRLDHAAVRGATVDLQRRIKARFPRRSLWEVSGELVGLVDEIGSDDGVSSRRVRLARVLSRVGVAIVVLIFGGAVALAAVEIWSRPDTVGPLDWLSLIETLVNDLVFGGIAVFFLIAVPERMERARVLRVLHRLRSLAHVIDMHQLSKVPERLESSTEEAQLGLTRTEVAVYLDQCTELLSLVGKTAALFAEDTSDGEVVDAVEGIESLTSDMARKIWQKVAIIQQQR
ncbi:hypothetical protein [Parenemella sanctibonifatiensis]|uniref:hypothetical protein n=1 Tax=Parenemella sanctibonifatiensis TaxID=2016505 RepID=UPI001E3B32D6|nr:hypothetical protein [Parenemella sanctibonifatiensis]